MAQGAGYGQFCPVAKAAEVIANRWTPLILRELVSGSSGFNEIHRGVPLMSRALLSQRLKALQAAGIVTHRERRRNARISEYRLTPAGEALRPVIVSMGLWGR
jgi:DNA-binding HxlR family transcriptional regulator